MVDLKEEILVREIVDEIKSIIKNLGYEVALVSFDKNMNNELEIVMIKK
ncbi:MAG: hypothetical protein ACRCZO_16295 [Cetobacterium sp.]